MLNGQKIPDWHNLKEVAIFLEGRNALSDYPLFKTIYEIAYNGAAAHSVVTGIRSSLIRSSRRVASPPVVDLQGRRCLVTGAAGGIGQTIVATLLQCNAQVIAVDSSASSMVELQRAVSHYGGLMQTRVLDITDVDATNSLVQAISAEADGPVQLLVNCAGVARFEPYLKTVRAQHGCHPLCNVCASVAATPPCM